MKELRTVAMEQVEGAQALVEEIDEFQPTVTGTESFKIG